MSESRLPAGIPNNGPAHPSAKKKKAKGISFEQITGERNTFELGTPATRKRSATLGGRATSRLVRESVLPRPEPITNTGGANANGARYGRESVEHNGGAASHHVGSPAARLKARHEREAQCPIINDLREKPTSTFQSSSDIASWIEGCKGQYPTRARAAETGERNRQWDQGPMTHRKRQATSSNILDMRAEKSFAACLKDSHEQHACRGEQGTHADLPHARLERHLSSTSDLQRGMDTPANAGALEDLRPEFTVKTVDRALHSSHDSMSTSPVAQDALDDLRGHLPRSGYQSKSIPVVEFRPNAAPTVSTLRNAVDGPISPLPRFGFDEDIKPRAEFERTKSNLDGLFNDLQGPISLVPRFGFDEHIIPTAASGTIQGILDRLFKDLHGPISFVPRFGFDEHVIPTASYQVIQSDLDSLFRAVSTPSRPAGPIVPLASQPQFSSSSTVVPPELASSTEPPRVAPNTRVLPQVLGTPRRIPVKTLPACGGAVVGQNAVHSQDADDLSPENLRPAPQNLRYGPFQTQQTHQSRNTPLGSGRLQNASKSGSGPSWGFGAPNGVSPLPSAQPRQTGTGATTFAQTIGGPPPAASLDLSEFPSLSGTSQPQYQNQSQAIWANQRAVQQTPVQRPQQQHSITSQVPQQHQQTQQAQDQSQRTSEDMFSASSHLPNSMDDHRYGSTGTLGQLPASRQPQTTNVDDFPPLGRNGTDENDDRRSNMMQNSGFGGFSGANAFSLPPDQTRNTLPSASSSQANDTRSPSGVDRLTSPNGIGFGASSIGRSSIEPIRQGTIGPQDQDRHNTSAAQGTQRRENTMDSLLNSFGEMQFPSQRQNSQPQQHDYVSRTGDAPGSAVTPDHDPPPPLSALEEFGLEGFLATARSENPDVSGLARGQDLTSLGLNLNSPEPLYPSFAGPFADVGSRPMQPDYKLPECYVVDNVHRVTDKVPSFHDETLFFIFYTQPRDILQELAATELTNRNWRYHKELRMWLTKDVSLGEPVQISPEKEQGSYSFWNPQTWEKMRVPNFELHYQQLAPSVSRPTF